MVEGALSGNGGNILKMEGVSPFRRRSVVREGWMEVLRRRVEGTHKVEGTDGAISGGVCNGRVNFFTG